MSIISPSMATTKSPDTDSLFSSTTSTTPNHVSKRRFLEIFSVQRGTPRESDTASRREEACLLNPCNVVAQWVTSQPVTVDLTLTCFSHSDVLGPSRTSRKQLASSTVHSSHLHVFRGFPFLHDLQQTSGPATASLLRLSVRWRC